MDIIVNEDASKNITSNIEQKLSGYTEKTITFIEGGNVVSLYRNNNILEGSNILLNNYNQIMIRDSKNIKSLADSFIDKDKEINNKLKNII